MFFKGNSENLNTLANLLQVASFILLMNEASNDKLLKELQNQDELYLDKIIEQNEIIISQNEEIIKKLERLNK